MFLRRRDNNNNRKDSKVLVRSSTMQIENITGQITSTTTKLDFWLADFLVFAFRISRRYFVKRRHNKPVLAPRFLHHRRSPALNSPDRDKMISSIVYCRTIANRSSYKPILCRNQAMCRNRVVCRNQVVCRNRVVCRKTKWCVNTKQCVETK